MASPVLPHSSDEVVKHLLTERLRTLEQALDEDVIVYRGPMAYGVDDLIREAIEKITPKRQRIAMVLQTEGGYVVVVERIVKLLRHHYRHVSFIVPNYAFSAGTILVMSGDVIRMDYYSVLGPIDPQVQLGGGRWIPAIGYLEKYDELVEKSNKGDLSSAELAFMLEKFDPAELFKYEQERELSQALLKEWLVQYKFKDWGPVTETRKEPVTKEMKERRAEEIAKQLNDPTVWHTHGRGISMQVLIKDLNLKIDDFAANPTVSDAI
jgi:ClpP class serine protease